MKSIDFKISWMNLLKFFEHSGYGPALNGFAPGHLAFHFRDASLSCQKTVFRKF